MAIALARPEAGEAPAGDPCAQPSPVGMAKETGVELPRYPWHLANIWWTLKEPVKDFALVEVYATAPLPKSPIPKVEVTFGWPRINGRPAAVTGASAHYPDRGTQAGPDCATIRAEGDSVWVSLGKIFKRDPAKRSHPLKLDAPGG